MALPTTTAIGNIQKIETKQTQSGKSVTKISLSCGQKNAKGEWDNLYIDGTFWEKQSDFVSQYFNEGDAIEITGKLVTTNYTNNAGVKVYKTEFLFPQASFLPKSKNTPQHNATPPNTPSYSQPNTNTPPQQNVPQANPQQNSQQGVMPNIDVGEIPFSKLVVV